MRVGCVGSVKAFTVVHYMCGVEVVDAEIFGNVGGDVTFEGVEVTFDAIYQAREEAAVAIGGVEEGGVTEAGCVEGEQLAILEEGLC